MPKRPQPTPSNLAEAKELTVDDVRRILSVAEDQSFKERIDRAEKTLEDLKSLLTHAPILHNGKLSTGTIEYAAFRVQTLSLIFEFAKQSLRRASQGADGPYEQFLSELGDEVGLTFARDLMGRLIQRKLLLPFQDTRNLLELWASFENDTGAGETRITHYSQKSITIQLRNNPLRRAETTDHAHCGFYKSYISSLINELFTIRARYLSERLEDVSARAQSVFKIEEKPDADDHCVFIAHCVPERLVLAFDRLTESYNQFYRVMADDDFASCMGNARGALVAAQMEAIGITDERPPRNLHMVYKGLVPNHIFTKMDETYQRVSQILHPESKSRAKLDRRQAWILLRDVRRCVYALEFLDLDAAKKKSLRDQAVKSERLATIEELANKAKDLEPEDRKLLRDLIAGIKKGGLSDEHQLALVKLLRKAGDKVWEVSRPILSDVVTSAIKSQFGLD